VIIEKGEDGYFVANVVELPGCHTQARTMKELYKRIREVVELYLESEGSNTPEIEFVTLKELLV
jgi:predicted RNase H-like HicB family nuclease